MNEKFVSKLLNTYRDAWVKQDTKKILSIFQKNGTYHERAYEKPFKGHAQIKKYWQNKVVNEQSRIKFELLNKYVCGQTIIAEWEASFYSNVTNETIKIKEVAIIEIQNQKIKSLREYWHSKRMK